MLQVAVLRRGERPRKRPNRKSIAASTAALTFAGLIGGLDPAAAAPPDPSGLWATKDDESIIEIVPCGQFFCGVLVWLKEPNDGDAGAKTDGKNEDESKRDRPLIGIDLLLDLAPDKAQWRGKAYNPEDGKTYDITFKLGPGKAVGDKAEIRGCVLKILCQSETFTRVQAVPGKAPVSASPAPAIPKPATKGPAARP